MATAAWPLPWSSSRMCCVLFHRVHFLASSAESLNYSSVKKHSTICTSRWVVPRVTSSCDGGGGIEKNEIQNRRSFGAREEKQLSCVMKFGGSSVASAEGMRNVADLMRSEERPVIVLSAMGKTTNKLLLAGEKASNCCDISYVSAIDEFIFIKDLHLRTVDELGVDRSIIVTYLEELEQLLKRIVMEKKMTLKTRDYLVSFGECMSTRIFAAYVSKIGVKARQYDAFEIGFTTTDDFTNADILEETYVTVAKRLNSDWICDAAAPIVTGFLGKEVIIRTTPEPYILRKHIPKLHTAFQSKLQTVFFS